MDDLEQVDDDIAGNGTPPRDLHSRLVATPVGQSLAAAIVAFMSLWIVAPNMPASAMRTWVDGLWAPANAIGLQQDWGVFSPNPRDHSLDVRARIEYADGTIEFWDLPEYDPILGAYRQYRWQKWQERVRNDESALLWEPTARWIAENKTSGRLPPTRIVLIRRWIDHVPLTIDGVILDGGWNEYEFYTWEGPS